MITYDPDFQRWGLQEPRRFDSGRLLAFQVLGAILGVVVASLVLDRVLRFLGLRAR